jgi:drug/metabolite transporter (DMT)-like permease
MFPHMNGKPAPGDSSTIFRIAGIGASLAFGGMVATLFAVKPIPHGHGLTFVVTVPAVIAFVVAALCAWFYWRMVERMALDAAPEQRRKKFVLFSAGLGVIGIVSFLYPIKFVPEEKQKDVFIGLALAVGVLSGVGFVLLRVKKFLDADLKRSEETEP